MANFPDLLARRLAADPGQPFVTFYDDASGERTELSVQTYSNWVSKTANLFADELMLDPGDDLRIDLPPHWLGVVFLGGLLSCGLGLDDGAPVAIVGPDGVSGGAGLGVATTMACSLRPFAVRFAEPLPPGVLDHGVLWAGQSDVFSPIEPTELDPPTADDRRVITDLNPLSAEGRELVLGLVAGSGSLVLVTNSDDGKWPAHSQSERVTAAVRATG
ncbi:TIGR03089 family protein [Nocardioides marmoriginsengisoli]|uniref:TIGR03089 family protein n=1 Tax=Nocardioides marmoriginsengisoli TaxID=661483 RepID=A0A3N0CHY9_9ACTN|nr:TIGR03089 family protein [Nocardioides marmoriginsengisoli]RNL63040.1 TIGR03089 family protein [Nocardioides marmoriginsengisoli]